MILNQQSQARVDLGHARSFVARLRRGLSLRGCDFNVCFVDDDCIRGLNAAYRGQPHATDVLSFPWQAGPDVRPAWKKRAQSANGRRRVKVMMPVIRRARRGADAKRGPQRELDGFLGDVIISVESARRNAAAEGHAVRTEICWLILHGFLHLVGYDHETDDGEMVALELAWRERLGV